MDQTVIDLLVTIWIPYRQFWILSVELSVVMRAVVMKAVATVATEMTVVPEVR
jgi:hypothetical protein